jgi:hypothetical protein
MPTTKGTMNFGHEYKSLILEEWDEYVEELKILEVKPNRSAFCRMRSNLNEGTLRLWLRQREQKKDKAKDKAEKDPRTIMEEVSWVSLHLSVALYFRI